MTFTLVFPSEAKYDEGKISVLAPVGTAMLGYRVGDIIEWEVPSGMRRLMVEGLLYQPEAAGDIFLRRLMPAPPRPPRPSSCSY